MNKIFKVVWSKVRNAYVVVSEIAKNTVSGVGKRNRIGRASLAATLAASVLTGGFFMPNEVWAAVNISLAEQKNYIAIRATGLTDDQKARVERGETVRKGTSWGSLDYTYILVKAGNTDQYYWVQDGYTIYTEPVTTIYNDNSDTKAIITKITGEASNSSFDAISTIQVHDDQTNIQTVIGDHLENVTLNPFGAASNSTAVAVRSDYTFILNEGTNEQVVIKTGGETQGNITPVPFNQYFKVAGTTSDDKANGLYYDEATKTYTYKGHHVHNNSVYYIDTNGDSSGGYQAGVFIIDDKVYDGTVKGANGEILLTGQIYETASSGGVTTETSSLVTYWGSEIENFNMTIAESKMTIGNLREAFNVLKDNDDELSEADVKSIYLNPVTNGATIGLNYNKANEVVPGAITVTGSGGSSGFDTSVTLTNVAEDGSTQTVTLNTGSVVSGNPVIGSDVNTIPLTAISINGNIYTVPTEKTSETDSGLVINAIGILNAGKYHGWEIRDKADNNIYADTTLVPKTSDGTYNDETKSNSYTIEDTAGNQVVLQDVASASKVNELFNNYNTQIANLNNNTIKNISVDSDNSTIALIRDDTGSTPVTGTLSITSGGGKKEGNDYVDTYVTIKNDQNTTGLTLNTGSKVEAITVNNTNRLDGLTINGEDYDIPSWAEIGTAITIQDYYLKNGSENIGDINGVGANTRGYKVGENGVIELKVENDGTNPKSVYIADVARYSDVGSVSNLLDEAQANNISEINNNVTTHIEKLYQKVGETAVEASKHTNVMGTDNITVTRQMGSTNQYVSLNNHIILGDLNLDGSEVEIDGDQGYIYARKEVVSQTAYGETTLLGEIVIDAGENEIRVGLEDGLSHQVIVNGGDTAEVTGLTNTTLPWVNDAWQGDGRAATEEQLQIVDNKVEAISLGVNGSNKSIGLVGKDNDGNSKSLGDIAISTSVNSSTGEREIVFGDTTNGGFALITGSIVKANDDVGGTSTVEGPLKKLEVNGKVYSVATSDSVTSAAAAAKTVVLAGKNVDVETVVKNANGEDGHTEYTVNAKKTIVNGDGNVVVGTPVEDVTNHTITYGLSLANTVTIGSDVVTKVTIDGTNGTITGLNNIIWNADSIVSGRAATEDQLKAVWDDTVVSGSVNHVTGKIMLTTNDGGTVEVGKLRDYAIQDEDVIVTGDKAILTVKDRYSDASYSVNITGISSTDALESAKTEINNQITTITDGSAIKFNTIGNDKLGLVNASGGTLSSVTVTSQVGTGGLVGVVNGAKDATITFTGTNASNPVVVTVGSTVSGTLNNGVLTAIEINGENYDLFTASEQNLSVSGSTHGWVLTDSSDTDGDNMHYDTTLDRSSTTTGGDAANGYSFTVADTAGTTITVDDIASASNLNSLKTVVDGHTTNIADLSSSINTINSTVANNYSTLSGNDIHSIVVTPNSGANATGGTVALWRNSTTGTTDTVPGTLTFTSGGGTEETGDTYVHISGEGVNGNVQILLHTGTKVEANSTTADDSTMTQLTLLTVNGKDYFIPEMDVDQNGNAVFQDYHVTNGSDTLYTYEDSGNTTVAVKGYSVDAEHGVVELHVHDRHQNTGSHEGIVRIGNLANKTTQDAHTKQLTGTVMYDAEGEGYNYNSIKLGEAGTSNYSNKTGGVNVTNVAYANGSDGSAAVNVDLLNDRIATVTTQATAAKTTLSETGKNITVGKTGNLDGSTKYTVNLNDNITLGTVGGTNVNINGNNGAITATTKDGNNNTTGQVTIDSANNKITVGVGGSNNNQVVINGGTGTITGLTNTTWDGTNVVANRAATEGQLQAAISNIQTTVNNSNITGGAINNDGTITLTKGNGSVTLTGKLSDNSLVAGTYDINSANNVVLNISDKYDTAAVTTATIQDVAKASNLGDVSQLNVDLKQTNNSGAVVHTNVVDAVNKLDDKVNQGWTSKVNGTDVQNIKMGGSQNFVDGTNIKLTAGENNSIKVSTATDVKFEKVTVGDVVMDSDGINAGNKKITNVAAGTEDNDAVNVKQLKEVNANASAHANFNTQHIENLYGQDQYLDSRINQLGSKVNKVGAGAAALAALHPMDFDPDDKLSFAVGAGNYAGENATALGAFYRPNEKVMMNVAGTYGNGENMVNMGVSFALDRTNNVSNSRTAMAKEIVDLREQVATQGQQIAQLVALVQQLAGTAQPIVPAEQLFPDVPQNHWAYEYVNGLIAKGIIEGYPDGTFGGDRAMTRYEFAAMLFRAMEQGVVINEQVRQEFEPELGRIRVDRVKGTDADLNKIERVRVNTAIDHDDYGSKVVQVKH